MKRFAAISILLAFAISILGCNSEKSAEEKITWGRADAKEINLTSKISGRVVKFNVAEGSRVNRGDIIAQIDQRDLLAQKSQIEAQIDATRAQKLQSQANLESAKSDLSLAKANFDRYEMLMNENAISRQLFEQYKTQYDVALSNYNRAQAATSQVDSSTSQAQATLEQIEIALDETEIRAPFDGIITEKFVEEGSIISQSTPIVAIQDPLDNWIDLKIPETELKDFRLNQRLEFLARDGETRIDGIVVDISRKAEFATQRATSDRDSDSDIITFNVKIQTDNEFVRPGMRFKLEGEIS